MKFPCELALLCGLLLVAFSVCLFVRSGYGTTVISSIPLMLSYAIPELDFGTWNIIYQLILIGLCILMTRKANGSYAFSIVVALVFSFFLNFMKALLADIPKSTELDLIYIVLAHILLFFGVSFFMRCYIPLLPVDIFIRDAVITYRIKYRTVKTAFDISCIAISAAICWLSLGKIADIGIGTVVSACVTGYFVAFITARIYDRFFEFVPVTRLAERFLSDDAPCKTRAEA